MSNEPSDALAERAKASLRITWIGAIVNLLLAFFKILAGKIGASHALIADGVHSLADLISDALVLFAAKFGNQDADQEHPYGHGRIETVATSLIALLLFVTGVGIIYDGIWHLISAHTAVPATFVLYVAILSIVTKEILFQYTQRIAIQYSSELLRANAWHHRSDALSSIVVCLGMIGVLLGFVNLDAIAACVVGFMIMHMGWNIGAKSIRELIDTGVSVQKQERIKQTIMTINGVDAVHQLRTRSMGGNILVDVHVMVDPYLSVSEGHHISEQVYLALSQQYDHITDVTVHIDPEDDEIAPSSLHLPNRDVLLEELNHAWQAIPEFKTIQKITLHYLNGAIQVDVLCPYPEGATQQSLIDLHTQFNNAQYNDHISQVRLLFTVK